MEREYAARVTIASLTTEASAVVPPRGVAAAARMPLPATRTHRLRRMAGSGVAWGVFVSTAVVTWTLLVLGGLEYYRTPFAVRGYAPAHHLLKPSGPIGQSFGLAGTALMLVPFVYMARKRVQLLKRLGTARAWLEVHLFCGIVGPVLVTLHTSFKFNGIVSAAYGSMVAVVLSGFVGRYLFVRIPRSIKGNELTRAELDRQAADLTTVLAHSTPAASIRERVDRFEESVGTDAADLTLVDLLFGELGIRHKLRALNRDLERSGVTAALRRQIVRIAGDRAVLLRRIAYLHRTKRLFELWHVFHLPLVYLLLVITAAHIAVALYLGYVPFRW